MLANGKHYRTIWLKQPENRIVQIIDQRFLPWKFVVEDIASVEGMCKAIKEMHLRGAGLIGAAGAYGMYLACLEAPKNKDFYRYVLEAAQKLKGTRPTAVNLSWAIEKQLEAINQASYVMDKLNASLSNAIAIADLDVQMCKKIGEHGVQIIEEIAQRKGGKPVNILTHCNAGWLAFVDVGTATAPVYEARKKGIPLHIFVSETRPRNQGASLTAWELEHEGIPFTVIADNASGHIMQRGMADMVIVGCDRCTKTGDVANKIGTYLKALAAKENNVPFYAAVPSSSIDWDISDGIREIPIEERSGDEVKYVTGADEYGELKKVLVTTEKSKALNYGFDVTPARLITGLITERGVCKPSELGDLSKN
ncbi:S-methyl-5-thioribose-1-phosphate isomerase [Candidatus Woesearchaeota archaeon]|nr:S-methyl-5-thioribose-1-phosphate isomerase [Candidatus Woesearchaeota archaeon]